MYDVWVGSAILVVCRRASAPSLLRIDGTEARTQGLLLRPHPLACSHALKFLKTEQLDRRQFVRGLPRTARSAAVVRNRREVARFPRLHALVPRCLPAENGQGGTSRVAVQTGATVAEEVQKPSAAWDLAALR